MNTSSQITIRAPLDAIFETTSDLAKWPEMLPHYRYVHFLERSGEKSVIVMAARRGVIPIAWVSELIVDREKKEVHFHHLRYWTKGMDVVWTYEEKGDGVLVTIRHDLRFRVPWLAFLMEPIIANFIHAVAGRTLATFQTLLEKEHGTTGQA